MTSMISLEGGKYVITHENGLNLQAFRWGEEWRKLTGDKLVLAMCTRIEQLERALRDIINIEHKYDSGDWDEIIEAQEIAENALEDSE